MFLLAALAGFLALFIFLGFSKDGWKLCRKQLFSLLALLLLIPSSICMVPTGHTGIVSTFGKVESYVLGEGLNFKLPWQTVTNISSRVQKRSLKFEAFSSDIQQVDISCAVNFRIQKKMAQELYKNVGSDYYSTVIEPRVLENTKAVISKYTAEKLIDLRENLADEIVSLIAKNISEYGIEVLSISIEDIDFTDAFTNAVEAKQVAVQAKLQAETEQAQKTMEQKATAEREKIAADAKAYSVRVQAEAQAEANSKLSASITSGLIRYKEAEKWDGKLPEITGTESVIPVLGNKAE